MSFRLDPDPPFASVVAIEPHRAARRDTNGSDRWLAWLGDACDPDNMHVEHGCYRSLKSSRKKRKMPLEALTAIRHRDPVLGRARVAHEIAPIRPERRIRALPLAWLAMSRSIFVHITRRASISIGPRQSRTKILSETVRPASRTVGVWTLDVVDDLNGEGL